MSTNPLDFVTNFLSQPYPTMGLAPSAAVTKTGGTVVQEGSGKSALGQTAQSMWARIADAVPFGWTLGGLNAATDGSKIVVAAVKAKTEEGAQAVEGKVKSSTSTISGFFTQTGNTLRYTLIAAVVVIVIFFLAQIKQLFRSN